MTRVPTILLCAAAAVAGCTTTEESRFPVRKDISVLLERGPTEPQPIIFVTVTNNSGLTLCLPADVIRNSASSGMWIELRDAQGRRIRSSDPGYILPPEEGVIRLDPGASERGKYYLDTRFKLPRTGSRAAGRMQARARFIYQECDDPKQVSADSGWQAI